MMMGFGFALPFSMYIIYHLMAPHGVMQNFRASNGAYMNWAQNFLGNSHTFVQVYRPEFYNREQNPSLFAYTRSP